MCGNLLDTNFDNKEINVNYENENHNYDTIRNGIET